MFRVTWGKGNGWDLRPEEVLNVYSEKGAATEGKRLASAGHTREACKGMVGTLNESMTVLNLRIRKRKTVGRGHDIQHQRSLRWIR